MVGQYAWPIQLVDILAWPLVLVGLLVLFRLEVRGLIGNLRSLRWKEMQAEFDSQLDSARALVDEVEVAAPNSAPATLTASVQDLAEVAPRAAVLEAWRGVEEALAGRVERETAGRADSPAGRGRNSASALQYLVGRGLIDRPTHDLLDVLRKLRNAAAHAPAFTLEVEQAKDYVVMASEAVTWLASDMVPYEE